MKSCSIIGIKRITVNTALFFCVGSIKTLMNIYHKDIKPMEQAFKYNELRQHEVTGKSASYGGKTA